MIGLGKKQSGAEGAERFGHLGLGKMLGDELDALFVAVAGNTLEQFGTRAVAVRFGKSGDHGQGRQADESLDVVRALDGVIHVLAKERQTNTAAQADYDRLANVASFRR